jgi:aryl-alcohol dehydrogenase-like predicted oxidoreductase
MRYRLLGSSGLRVSELFLGAMTFGLEGGVGAPRRVPPHRGRLFRCRWQRHGHCEQLPRRRQ